LLHAIGIPELIAPTIANYETLAQTIAREPSLLTGLKTKLARNQNSTPLFDTRRYARNLERAYRQMWARAQRGLPPQSFAVEGDGP
jgi:predicted O-linked N-acetylglucosamine transferase (SPINDLY family)